MNRKRCSLVLAAVAGSVCCRLSRLAWSPAARIYVFSWLPTGLNSEIQTARGGPAAGRLVSLGRAQSYDRLPGHCDRYALLRGRVGSAVKQSCKPGNAGKSTGEWQLETRCWKVIGNGRRQFRRQGEKNFIRGK